MITPARATSIHDASPLTHTDGVCSRTSMTRRLGKIRSTRTSRTQGSAATDSSISPVFTQIMMAPSPTPAAARRPAASAWTAPRISTSRTDIQGEWKTTAVAPARRTTTRPGSIPNGGLGQAPAGRGRGQQGGGS